jgi:excisionase family DNA binding protein
MLVRWMLRRNIRRFAPGLARGRVSWTLRLPDVKPPCSTRPETLGFPGSFLFGECGRLQFWCAIGAFRQRRVSGAHLSDPLRLNSIGRYALARRHAPLYEISLHRLSEATMVFLSVDDVCQKLQISRTTIYKMWKQGSGPPFRYIGRVRRIREKDLHDWFSNSFVN